MDEHIKEINTGTHQLENLQKYPFPINFPDGSLLFVHIYLVCFEYCWMSPLKPRGMHALS